MKKIIALALFSLFSFVSAQNTPPHPLSAEEKKTVDAKAMAFTGRHCQRDYYLGTMPIISVESFRNQAKLIDTEFKQKTSQTTGVRYRSVITGDSFQAHLSKQGPGDMFIGMYYKRKVEMMSCFL